MKRFFCLNIEKIKTGSDYFLMTILFLILVQLTLYIPFEKVGLSELVSGIFFSGMFIYSLLTKKNFTYKDVLRSFWGH